ncbi:MAG: branched-chain amino acid ABC transporter permease, partial [Casimicrobium sp.]
MNLFPAQVDWRAPRTVVAVIVLAAFALLPFAVGSEGDFYVKFATRVLIYALAAIGLNFILGFGGMVSLGHAMYVMLGAYAVAIPAQHEITSGWAHLSIALAATLVISIAVGAVSLRTSGIAFIMITLAFAQMLFFGAVSLKEYGGDDGLTLAARSNFALFDITSHTSLYYLAFACVLLALYLSWRAVLSPFGLVLRGSKANARRALALGHPVVRYQLVAYILSALVCAVAGVLLANLTQFASPSYGA